MFYWSAILPYTEDQDFDSQGGSITFVPRGPKEQRISIPITDDQQTENDEPLRVSLSSEDIPPGTETIPSPMVIIIDNDISERFTLPTLFQVLEYNNYVTSFSFLVVGFDPTEYTVTEGEDPSAVLTIVREGNLDLSANVTFMTVPGTADGIYTNSVKKFSLVKILTHSKPFVNHIVN